MKVCKKCGVEKDDAEFINRNLKCWDCLREIRKEYNKSEAGKLSAKKGRERHKKRLKEASDKRVRKNCENITDRYVIEQLLNVRATERYTLEYLKQNPEIIEAKRVQILKNRVLKLIQRAEAATNVGVCSKCKKTVPLSEFRFQKKTEKKRAHLQRWCATCKKEYSKQYWQKTKNNKA